jgi:hypothetical protein
VLGTADATLINELLQVINIAVGWCHNYEGGGFAFDETEKSTGVAVLAK